MYAAQRDPDASHFNHNLKLCCLQVLQLTNVPSSDIAAHAVLHYLASAQHGGKAGQDTAQIADTDCQGLKHGVRLTGSKFYLANILVILSG